VPSYEPLIIYASRFSFELLAATVLPVFCQISVYCSFDIIFMYLAKQTFIAQRSNCVIGLILHISLVGQY